MQYEKKILLVEDDALTAAAEKASLEKHGYSVLHAKTGEYAIELLKNNSNIAIVLMDIELGEGMDGFETADAVMKLCSVPIVFLTGHTETEFTEKAISVNSYGYIVKGYGTDVLIASIKIAINNHKAGITHAEKALNDNETGFCSKQKTNSQEYITENFHIFFDPISDPVFLADESTGQIYDANMAAVKTYGYSHSELLEKRNTDISAEPNKTLKAMGEHFSYIPVRWHKKKDGTIFPVEINANCLSLNGKSFHITLIRDITERKKAEEALQNSIERFRMFFELGTIGMAIISPEKEWIEVNDRTCEILGYSKEEMALKKWTDITHPLDIETDSAEFDSMIAGEIDRYSKDKRFIRKDGQIIHANIGTSCIRRSDGRVEYVISFINDITERKNAEEKIGSLLAEKELILKEVHHRIKNNMNTINSLISLQAATLKDKPAIVALEDAGRRVRSMMMLYEKLYKSLDFKEIPVINYLSPLVDEIIGNFPNSSMISVEKKIDDFVLAVKKIQPLGIIINEILTNIMKYAFTGRLDGKIQLAIIKEKNHVTVSIHDNGSGMPDNINFDESSGFGLMLVGLLTKQIEGSIKIERGYGTRIVLDFDA